MIAQGAALGKIFLKPCKGGITAQPTIRLIRRTLTPRLPPNNLIPQAATP